VVVQRRFREVERDEDLPLPADEPRPLCDGAFVGGGVTTGRRSSSVAMLRHVSPAVFSITRMRSSAGQHSCTCAVIRSDRRW
jgi:hypothetical protein